MDFQEEKLDPNMDFYILGLSPNAARLSVRFFLHNTFQGFLEHIQSHYRRLEIIRPSYDKFETLPIWKLLDEKRDAFDPRAFLAPIMDTVMYGTGDEGAVALITDAMRRGVKEAVGTLIVEFGSYGKAPLVEPATLEDMAARYAKEG